MTPADKSYEEKVLTLEVATALRSRARTNSNRIVFTNGCFDLLHRGHVTFLQRARALGDVLILGLNSDHSVRRLKGPGRPILLMEDRVALLAGLESVDHICVFEEDTPEKLLHLLLPDILVREVTTRTTRSSVEILWNLVGAKLLSSPTQRVVQPQRLSLEYS